MHKEAKGAVKGVVEPFGLRHSLLLQGLAPDTERLDMVHALTRPRSALAVAVMAPFPWRGIGIATYVLNEESAQAPLRGFAQVLKRTDRPESDMLALAPVLTSERHGAEEIWIRLLTRMVQDGGQHGVQRIFASVPADGREADVFRQVGFVPYTQETIFRLDGTSATLNQPVAGIRPQQDSDAWAFQRLYQAVTPPVVQQAEGAAESESSGFLPAWWESGLQAQGYVASSADGLAAAVQMLSGPAGHWLRLWSLDSDRQVAGRLLDWCLAALRPARRAQPVYLAVRDYQSGLRTMLQDRNFRPYLRRTRLVKHLVVRVKEMEPALMPLPRLVSGVF